MIYVTNLLVAAQGTRLFFYNAFSSATLVFLSLLQWYLTGWSLQKSRYSVFFIIIIKYFHRVSLCVVTNRIIIRSIMDEVFTLPRKLNTNTYLYFINQYSQQSPANKMRILLYVTIFLIQQCLLMTIKRDIKSSHSFRYIL